MDEYKELIKILISYINNEQLDLIITLLNSSFWNQKIFIDLIQKSINESLNQNEIYISLLQKLNKIIPDIIQQLGIPFCELLNEQRTILNYYYDLYFQSNSFHKNILLNFINIFNYESIENNLAYDYIEKLQNKAPNTCSLLKTQKRKNKTRIENFYDEIISLFSNLRIRINIEDNFDDEILKYFESAIKEKSENLKQFENENKFPKATIEFFQEKIKNLECLFNDINKDKDKLKEHNNKFNKQLIKNSLPMNTEINLNNSEFNIEEILKELRDIPLKNRTSFYKDEQLSEGEDEFTEFKNYYLPLTEEKGEELKRQFCAFLNNKGGRLYLGINDQKIVKGVILNYKKCDNLRNLLVNYTYDFYPKCRLDKIKVYFIPIKSMKNNKFINDLYVVKIIVLQGDPNVLYSMTTKGFISAIRLQGQCANLTAEEITKEIIRRGKLSETKKSINLYYANNQFNDPEPEKNYENEHENTESIDSSGDIIINDKNQINKINKKDIFVVEVKNIDQNLDINYVYDTFKDCGSFYQKFYSKDGKSRGYGLLKFSDENIGLSAINKMYNLLIGEKRISLIVKNKSNFF